MIEHLESACQYLNYLDHYFEMSFVDAEQALVIYRHFASRQNSRLNFSAWQKDFKIDSMYPPRV